MEVSSELDEEVVHLTRVSGITVRVHEGEPGKRVFPEGGEDLVATFGVENVSVDVFVGGDTRHCWVTSVRWNLTSGRSEKVEHHISEEKTHKPEP